MFPLAVCLLTVFGFALVVDPSNPIAVLLAMVSDFQSRSYLLALAVGVAFVVSLAKQGWLSFWLQSKLPSWALPILAFVVAVGGAWSTEVQSAIPWSKALWDALNAAALAVFAHQMLVEHMRGGKEIVPARKPPAPPASSAGSPSGPRSVPPKAPTVARLGFVAMLGGIVALCVGCLSSAPIVPVTPANQDQVTTCQGIATEHNAFVVGDMVIGGATTGLGTIAGVLPADQSSAKSDLALVAAGTAAIAAVGAALSGVTAASFSNSQCSNVVGALPANQGQVK
jgi:hypothetical protein